MKSRLRGLSPSPAMVIACLALLAAFAGTSVAAVTIVIPRNSVGSLQLKANSVNSAKVKNGSLLRADFKAGQIPAGPAGPTGPAGPAGPAGAAGIAAPGYVAQVLTASSTSGSTTSSTTYTDLNNATVNLTVPTGETDMVVGYYSGETSCAGGSGIQRCQVRITVDGTEMSPAAGSSAAFDNNDLGTKTSGCSANPCTGNNFTYTFNSKGSGDRASNSIIRYSANLAAGAHTVKVQYGVTNNSVAFTLTNWAFVIQRVKVS